MSQFLKLLLLLLGSSFLTTSCVRKTPTVQFDVTSQTVQESQGVASVTMSLSTAASMAVRVPYTLSGTATGGGTPADDYNGADGILTIPIGKKSASVDFPLITHGSTLPDRTMIVTMGKPENAKLGTENTQTVTISNVGAPPPPPPTSVVGSFPGAITPDDCGTGPWLSIPFTLDQSAPSNLTFPMSVNAGGLMVGTDYSVTVSATPAFVNPGVSPANDTDIIIPSGSGGAFVIIAVSSCAAVTTQTISVSVTAPVGHTVSTGTTSVTFP